MVAHGITGVYAALTKLLADYRQQPVGKQHLLDTLALAEQWLKGLVDAPDTFTAQLCLYKKHYPHLVNYSFNAALCTALLCARNQFNESSAQQLICASITLSSCRQGPLHSRLTGKQVSLQQSPDKRLLLALQKTGQQLWQHNYQVLSYWDITRVSLQTWPQHFNQAQQITFMAQALAWQITPKKEGYRSFANALVYLARACPPRWLALLEPLMSYPGLYPPGSVCKDALGQWHILLSLDSEQAVFTPLKPTQQESPALWQSPIQELTQQPKTGPGISDMSLLDKWWHSEWQEQFSNRSDTLTPTTVTFRIDSPPPTLLRLQQRLNEHDIEADELARIIEEEPLFARYLRDTARQSSRENLPIRSVKQGLLMHGFERTGSLLMQYALLQRINQHYFPLQQSLLQFTLFRTQVAAELATSIGKLGAENMATLATFASGGLFTLPQFKSVLNWQPQQHRLFDVTTLVQGPEANKLNDHCVKLSEAWQQPRDQVMAIRSHHHQPWTLTARPKVAQMAAILGLSLVAARQVYFAGATECSDTQEYVQRCLSLLGIGPQVLTQCQQFSAVQMSLFCPFPR